MWLTNVPSPYRVDFFNELGKWCDLTVLFEKVTSTERVNGWEKHEFNYFQGVFLKGISVDVDKSFSIASIKYLKKHEYDHIVVSDIATPTGISSIIYMKIRKISYLLEGDGGFAKSGKGIKEHIKKWLIQGAKGYLSTSRIHDEYYRKYGAKNADIYRYPFTSVSEKDIKNEKLSIVEIKKIKKELNIKEEKVVLSVGQFIERKGFDVLIQACEKLQGNIRVIIIGGMPLKSYLLLIARLNIYNVTFAPYQSKEKLKAYFQISDLFVLPTREDIWGLVINEAMGYGLPVITTSRCIAGVELIKDFENGFIVAVDDVKDLTQKINLIMNNDHLREKMEENNFNKIQTYTIENMAKRHLNIFKEISS
ncbi:glycosyltransferase family 4 protein [Lachnospiraceae bacterium LCP25S3_G4]